MSNDLDDLLSDDIEINTEAIQQAQKLHVIYEIPIITNTTNKETIELKPNQNINKITPNDDYDEYKHKHTNKTENDVSCDDDAEESNECSDTYSFVWFYFWFIVILMLFSYLLTWMIKQSWRNKLEHEYLEQMQYIYVRH
jgi:ATP-dependent Zn protease